MAVLKHNTLRRIATPVVMAELPEHNDAIEALVDLDFGPERFRKTAYRLRDGLDPVESLGLVALEGDRLVGTIRFWEVSISDETPALLLGPLAIHPDRQGQGIGHALMNQSLDKAHKMGWKAVLLVGDAPYYTRFGFRRDLAKNLTLPGPVDPARFLGLELEPGALNNVNGLVGRAKA
jgi:predicted N-acetyltransferase YhbS